ncbi:MAG: hypothetical protein ACI8QZ_000124 [Chlamydiales bacterium]|jgi:hypothetical protein
MTNVRVWITVLALISFLAGTAAGKILTGRSAAGDLARAAERGALADYEALFGDQFELDEDRRALLRVLLEHYEQEVTRIRNDHLSSYRSAIEPELRRVGIEYNQYIRDKVLPPAKRPVFDQLARGPLD